MGANLYFGSNGALNRLVVSNGAFLSDSDGRLAFQVVTSALSLTVSGTGTVSGRTNGEILEIGRGYQLTATPGVGSVFSNWTGTVSGTAPTLGFLMQSNMAAKCTYTLPPRLSCSNVPIQRQVLAAPW